jgi:hypothetical protein
MPFPSLKIQDYGKYTRVLLFNHMGAVVTAGILLIIGTDEQYKSDSFIWTFSILPRQVWGVLFVMSALLVYLKPRASTGSLFATVLFMYGMSLLAAVVTGDAESLSGWVWTALVGANMYLWTAYGRFNK